MLLVVKFFGVEAEGWYALGQVLVGVAAMLGSLWAILLFRSARRLDAARWLDGIFRDFYIDDRFKDVRWLLARRTFISQIVPILEKNLEEKNGHLSEDEAQVLRSFDSLLNFFEHVLYMESEKYLPKKARVALFGYWFELMATPSYEPLRQYVDRYGYEYLKKAISASPAKASDHPAEMPKAGVSPDASELSRDGGDGLDVDGGESGG